jgi:putative transcriptional regulator
MSKFYKDLKEGLEDIIAHKKGRLTLRSKTIDIPEPPAEYKARDIKNIRKKGNYSQGVFAKVLNVSVKTVQSWESGERVPSHATLRLLEIVDKGIYRPDISKRR